MSAVSCYQDVIDLDFSEFESQIVIEGNITDQPGPYTVNISRTASHNRTDRFPLVAGAEVIISDDAGNAETLREEKAGCYRTREFEGVPGRTYSLFVEVEGEEYSATCKMPEPMQLDSVGYDLYGSEAFLRVAFTNREGVDDYIRFLVYQNGHHEMTYLYQDRFEDAEHIEYTEFDLVFQRYDFVRIEMMTIDQSMYAYYSMLGDEGDNMEIELPDFIALTSFNPESNLSNNALGYFSAHTQRTYQFSVE
jgi:hypothetical protein